MSREPTAYKSIAEVTNAFLTQEHLEDTLLRAMLFAQRYIACRVWRGRYGGEPPGGVKAQDLVSTVVKKLLSGERHWHPRHTLLQTLQRHICSEVWKLVRSPDNQHTIWDEDEALPLTPQDFQWSPEEEVMWREERTLLLTSLEDDKLVHEIARLILDDGITRPKDLAGLLDVDVRIINNAKKRLHGRVVRRLKEQRALGGEA